MPAKGTANFTLEKKAQVLSFVAITDTQTEAARLAGISRPSVHNILKEAETNPALRDAADQVKKSLDQKFEEAVERAIEAIIADAPNAKIKDSAQVCALVDKMRLLREQSTSIVQQLTPEQRKARIIELVRKAS